MTLKIGASNQYICELHEIDVSVGVNYHFISFVEIQKKKIKFILKMNTKNKEI